MTSELRVDKIVPTSGVPTGGGGGITQVVFAENNNVQSFSFNNSVFDPQTVCSATITPKFNTSKILVYCSAGVFVDGHNNAAYEFSLHLKRGSTLVGGNTQPSHFRGTNVLFSATNSIECAHTGTFFYMDSPATTSAVTYNLCLQGGENATYGVCRSKGGSGYNFQNSSGTNITLMEISA